MYQIPAECLVYIKYKKVKAPETDEQVLNVTFSHSCELVLSKSDTDTTIHSLNPLMYL